MKRPLDIGSPNTGPREAILVAGRFRSHPVHRRDVHRGDVFEVGYFTSAGQKL